MMQRFNQLLESFHRYIAPYDQVRPLSGAEFRLSHRIAALIAVLFAVVLATLVIGGFVDNKPTTASTGLVAAHRMATLNVGNWLREGIWWIGQQTPTPLPFSIHGAFFALFGFPSGAFSCSMFLSVPWPAPYSIASRRDALAPHPVCWGWAFTSLHPYLSM